MARVMVATVALLLRARLGVLGPVRSRGSATSVGDARNMRLERRAAAQGVLGLKMRTGVAPLVFSCAIIDSLQFFGVFLECVDTAPT